MKYSLTPGSFFLLFSLGVIVSSEKPVAVVLSTAELRGMVIEIVKTVESQFQHQLLHIQKGIDEINRKSDELHHDFGNQLQRVESECRRAAAELAPPSISEGVALNTSTLRNELLTIASDVVSVKESLERVKVGVQAQWTETVTSTASPTEVTPLYTSQPPAVSTVRKFEDGVTSKVVRIGSSFNGSTIDEISSIVSYVGHERRFATVEFVNYMNESVTDFQLYHEKSETPVYDQAPSQIAGNTTEVFTFREPKCCYQDLAFSYSIPSTNANMRIAIRLSLAQSADVIGLSFLSDNTSLRMYYRFQGGLPAAYDFKAVSLEGNSYPTTVQLSVRHQDFYANATMYLLGIHKANVKIELDEVR